jgi:hypothetical protein
MDALPCMSCACSQYMTSINLESISHKFSCLADETDWPFWEWQCAKRKHAAQFRAMDSDGIKQRPFYVINKVIKVVQMEAFHLRFVI